MTALLQMNRRLTSTCNPAQSIKSLTLTIFHFPNLFWSICFPRTMKIQFMICILILSNVDAARGGRRGGSRKAGSRGSSRLPIFIPRNQDGVSYYDNTNVSI